MLSADSSSQWLIATDKIINDTTTWHHIVGIWDGNTMKVYLDGKQSSITASRSGTLTNTAHNFSIGRLGAYNNEYFQGQIDDVRIYNYALTQEQVKQVMNEVSAMSFGN